MGTYIIVGDVFILTGSVLKSCSAFERGVSAGLCLDCDLASLTAIQKVAHQHVPGKWISAYLESHVSKRRTRTGLLIGILYS